MNMEINNELPKLEQSLTFLLKCFKEIDIFNADFSEVLEQMEAEAKERVINFYCQNLSLY